MQNAHWQAPYVTVRPFIKNGLRIMRLMTLFIMAACLQVGARGLAQSVSLSVKNAPLEKVFTEIEKQTGYSFVYATNLSGKAAPVTLQLKNASLNEALAKCFANQPFSYKVISKVVIVNTREEPAIQMMVTADFEVRGKVTDDQGHPLPGITVHIKGTQRTTATDKDGAFTIKAANATDVVIFTSIGQQTQEVALNGRSNLNITLTANTTELGEVRINTGFQTIRKEELTGATVTVGSAELQQRYQPNILTNLEGRVPGLITYRGTTQIRGVSTLQASKDVLIVVDGLPIEGAISDINPYDVESITVLKDAAAAAIYGARASNGVIVVVTKRAREKRTAVEFSTDVTVTDKPDIDFHLLTPAQTVDLESGYWNWYYFGGTQANPVTATTNDINLGNSVSPVRYAYFQLAQGKITQDQLQSQLTGFKQNNFRQQYKDNALLNNVLQQYNLSIRTNGEKLQSSIVVNYKTDNTGRINNYDKRFNLFYKGTYFVSKWLSVNYGVNTVLGQANASNSSLASSATNVPAYLQLLDAAGNQVNYTTTDFNLYNTIPQTTPQLKSLLFNHLDELSLDRIKSKSAYSRFFLNMDLKLTPGLTFHPYFQYESNQVRTSANSEAQSYAMRLLSDLYTTRTGTAPNYTYNYLLPTTGGRLTTTLTNGNYWTARGQLNYDRRFGKHGVNVIAGTEFRQQNINGTKGLLLGYDDQLQSQSTGSVNFNALSLLTVPGIVKTQFQLANTYQALANSIGLVPDVTHRFASAYANLSYTYNRRYTAFGSFRKDYADVFGLDPKYRGKPLSSVGAGWNIYNENFVSGVTWVNFLKLRASYGITGNINLTTTSFLTATTGTTNQLTQLPQAVISNPANPYLRWEKTATSNAGIDFALFDNRLSGSIDWYHKKSSDLFANTRLDPATGFSNYTVNNGGLYNNGIDLQLQYSWLKPSSGNGFSFTSLLVLSHNKNKITYVDQLATSPVALASGAYKVDYPVNSLFSFQYKGLTATGQPQWLKADGTLTTLALAGSDLGAVIYSGQTDPKNNISLTNIFQFKGFTLNVLMTYYGGQVLRAEVPSVYQAPTYGAMPSYLLDAWTPGKTGTIIPGFGQYVPPAAVPSFHLAYSDAFVHSGDFLKIRNVNLGYNLPRQWTGKLRSQGINLHFQLNNPKAVWKKNAIDIDPETGGVRIPTSYTFGLSINY